MAEANLIACEHAGWPSSDTRVLSRIGELLYRQSFDLHAVRPSPEGLSSDGGLDPVPAWVIRQVDRIRGVVEVELAAGELGQARDLPQGHIVHVHVLVVLASRVVAGTESHRS
jgi:hypothetical protein